MDPSEWYTNADRLEPWAGQQSSEDVRQQSEYFIPRGPFAYFDKERFNYMVDDKIQLALMQDKKNVLCRGMFTYMAERMAMWMDTLEFRVQTPLHPGMDTSYIVGVACVSIVDGKDISNVLSHETNVRSTSDRELVQRESQSKLNLSKKVCVVHVFCAGISHARIGKMLMDYIILSCHQECSAFILASVKDSERKVMAAYQGMGFDLLVDPGMFSEVLMYRNMPDAPPNIHVGFKV